MELHECKQVINELLVDIFNDILKLEHKTIESFAGNSLTMSEMHILEAIGNSSDAQMSDIAKKLRITLPTLTVSVQRLEEKNYITRQRHDTDRRKVTAGLTDKGQQAYEYHAQYHARMMDALFLNLELDKMPVLMDSMSMLRDFFRSQADQRYKD